MELVALVKQNSIFQPVKGENKRERRSTSSGKSKHSHKNVVGRKGIKNLSYILSLSEHCKGWGLGEFSPGSRVT